jgi:hypothetical protein
MKNMKEMKKLLLSALIMSGVALTSKAQFQLGVQAGVSANAPKVQDFTDAKNFTKPTYGIVAQYDFGGFIFRPSLNFLSTGFKSTDISTVANVTTTEVLELLSDNLSIPLDLVLPIKAKKGRFLVSVAPVVTIGLKAKTNSTETTQVGNGAAVSQTQSEDLTYGNDASADIKKVDWGGKIGVGYEFKKFQVNLGYKAGFNNLLPNNNNSSYKEHNLTLTLSYFLFGGKK